MTNSEFQYYRVTLTEGLEVDVTRLDVSLIEKSLEESTLTKERKNWIRMMFVNAIQQGRFRLMEGNIDEMGRRS